MNSIDEIIKNLERFGVSINEHGNTTLLSHLKGTHEILVKWNCDQEVSIAGLCHSIYGTESFSKTPARVIRVDYTHSSKLA